MATTKPTTSESVSEGLFTGAAGVTAVYFGDAFIASLQAAISNLDQMALEIKNQQDAAAAGAEATRQAGRKAELGYFAQGAAEALSGGIGIVSSLKLQSKQDEINGGLQGLRNQSKNLTSLEQAARTPPLPGAAGMNAADFDALKLGNKDIVAADINAFSANATTAQRQELLNNLNQVKNEISLREGTLRDFDTNYQMRTRAAEAAVKAGGNFTQGYFTYEKALKDAEEKLFSAVEGSAQGTYRVSQQNIETLISLLQTLVQAQQETARSTSK